MFALDGNPKFTTIIKEKIKIKFESRIIDFVDLDLPNIEDVYSGQVLKFVYVKNEALANKDFIMNGLISELRKLVETKNRRKKTTSNKLGL